MKLINKTVMKKRFIINNLQSRFGKLAPPSKYHTMPYTG